MDRILKGVEIMKRTETSKTYKINPRLQHAILGIADEAGEFICALKAAIYYDKPLDLLNLKEELGDTWWYISLAIDELARIERKDALQLFDEILAMNDAKLKARYPEKYSNEKAKQRDLDKEREVMEEQSKTNISD